MRGFFLGIVAGVLALALGASFHQSKAPAVKVCGCSDPAPCVSDCCSPDDCRCHPSRVSIPGNPVLIGGVGRVERLPGRIVIHGSPRQQGE
jgi:hypothetical protein